MFFDLSWSHILIFLIVALVVVGPKDLPKVMRKVGQWVAKARGMADQFRSSFDEMARQSELDELRREIESLRNARPLAETEKKFNETLTIDEAALNADTPSRPVLESAASRDVSAEAGEITVPAEKAPAETDAGVPSSREVVVAAPVQDTSGKAAS